MKLVSRASAMMMAMGVILIASLHLQAQDLNFQPVARPAGSPQYKFAVGDNLIYEITTKTESPSKTQTNVAYLMYRPFSFDKDKGQFVIEYQWAMYTYRWFANGKPGAFDFGYPSFLTKEAIEKPTPGKKFVIDQAGTVIRSDMDDGQIEGVGPAFQLMMQPLQPGAKNPWTTERKITLYSEYEKPVPNTGDMFWGPRKEKIRTEMPAVESITYTAGQPQNGELTIQRKLDLATVDKVGDSPIEHTTGDGEYILDLQRGILKSLEFRNSTQVNIKNGTFRMPMTVSVRLLPADELSKMQAENEVVVAEREKVAAANKARAKNEAERKLELNDLPEGMQESDQVGKDGGRKFLRVDADHKPLVGLRFKTGQSFGQKCFQSIEPLFEKPTDTPGTMTDVLAKDGYAIGAIVVNATDRVNAFAITFMKKTDSGLDPKTSYNSPWYGKVQGADRKKFGGDGKFIYGIFGVKNENVDGFGVIVEAPPADLSNVK